MDASKIKVVLKSDFSDYYDDGFDKTGIVYERLLSHRISLAKGIELLKGSGIQVIEPWAVRKTTDAEMVRVFTGGGRSSVCSLGEARSNYFNNLCVRCEDELILKVIFIGSTVLNVMMTGKVLSVDVVKSSVGKRVLNAPVFSIDCINDNGASKAIQLNAVERLESLEVQDVISKGEAIDTIKAYMKLRGF